MDTMLNTYNDSDSLKDLNPIYRIVDGTECNKTHIQKVIFDKFNFKYSYIYEYNNTSRRER